jgi:FkbM family methyltransferase
MNFKDIVRKSGDIKYLYWYVRLLLGLNAKTHFEEIYRIKRHGDKFGWEVPGFYKFQWGLFEYVSLGQLLIQYKEIYQKRHYAFLISKSDPCIIDCGGNIGLSAIWFLQNYPQCNLRVFEPDGNLAKIIRKNLALAGYNPDICDQKAVWIQDCNIGFDQTGDDKGKIQFSSKKMVEAVDISRIIGRNIDLLKLDIEGAEYDVIAHLCNNHTIAKINMIVCELHVMRGYELKMINILKKLTEAGMKISLNYGAVGPWIGLAEEQSPFEVIGRNQLLIEVYAWR